jgi:hypothetical protein
MPIKERFYSKISKPNENGCMEWNGTKLKRGYGHFSIKGKMVLAHRFAYELHYGIKPTFHVLHKCDNPSCVNPEHLFLGTDKDNSEDCRRKGRDTCFKKGEKPKVDNRGSKSRKAKLNENIVKEIKSRLLAAETIASLARKYSISPSIISGIKNGYRWSHVI